MENKKTKLTLSGIAKKSIENIELAKTQSKNSVVIEKKSSKFAPRSNFTRPASVRSKPVISPTGSMAQRTTAPKLSSPITNDYEKRKLAEQRATRRLKGDAGDKGKPDTKKRELKLTVSRALSDEIDARSRSMASLKRAKLKENRELTKEEIQESLKPIKRDVNIPEAITVRELSNRMAEQSSNVIKHLFGMGVTVTINQTLASDTAEYLVKEFGHNPIRETKAEEIIQKIKESRSENLKNRPPIVTVMGHVDHGKTSLLDFIRSSSVTDGESGGITQHIGAYSVLVNKSKKITFLDTPGHEAFTAMRARGAQITDIVIIVIAADDNIMPQTKEAISHAQAGGVPIIFAINKIDKEGANPDKVKESLASMNLVVEDWGGKIQSQDISALKGQGVDSLLEKVLLEAEIMDLKANPNKNSSGSVVEAYLDKGRGYVSTILVQNGTLKLGDYLLAGKTSGKVKAMFDEAGKPVKLAPPSTPVSVLGLDGAPQAGDPFKVLEDEKEAKMIATKRTQLGREQNVRTQKQLTLDEIGRRIAIGDFKELNVIIKGDVDGSVEALTDSFENLSTEEIQVNIIFKAVGAITESDVLLASASDAIIIGFNVKPTLSARKLSEKEQVDIRFYSIIYDAINDLKDAMEGMLSIKFEEENTGDAEVRETFKISKMGTIAGCMVTSGKIFRNSKVRVLRAEEILFDGKLLSLKRFKDDVKEVAKGYDCGIQVNEFNDLQEGDIIQCYKEVEVKRKL